MHYGDVKDRYKKEQIDLALVVRTRRNREERSGRESDFWYWVLFVPSDDANKAPDPRDYFLFRDRSGARDRMIEYKSLFSISKDMNYWGIRNYTILDVTHLRGLGDQLRAVMAHLKDRGRSVKPIQAFLNAWVAAPRE